MRSAWPINGSSKPSKMVPWKSSASRLRRWALPENLTPSMARSVCPSTSTAWPSAWPSASRFVFITRQLVVAIFSVFSFGYLQNERIIQATGPLQHGAPAARPAQNRNAQFFARLCVAFPFDIVSVTDHNEEAGDSKNRSVGSRLPEWTSSRSTSSQARFSAGSLKLRSRVFIGHQPACGYIAERARGH